MPCALAEWHTACGGRSAAGRGRQAARRSRVAASSGLAGGRQALGVVLAGFLGLHSPHRWQLVASNPPSCHMRLTSGLPLKMGCSASATAAKKQSCRGQELECNRVSK